MPRISKKTVASEHSVSSETLTFFAILVVLGILIIGGAVMVGKSDGGVINVPDTIDQANKTNRENDTGIEQVNAGSNAFQNMPNGGLVPAEHQPPKKAPVTEIEQTGTSTEATQDSATTTPEGATEESVSDETSSESAEATTP